MGAETAGQAVQRVTYAAGMIFSNEPQGQDVDPTWVEQIRTCVKAYKETGEEAFSKISGQGGQGGGGASSGGRGAPQKSVFGKGKTCRHWMNGSCPRGNQCTFS